MSDFCNYAVQGILLTPLRARLVSRTASSLIGGVVGRLHGCLDGGAQEAKVTGGVGAVGELVDRADGRQVPDLRVGDLLPQGGEPGGIDDLVRPVEETARPRVERRGEPSWLCRVAAAS
jgi:hypothetical protein